MDLESGMWAIVELMGHVRLVGYVTEVEAFGRKMGRIDIETPEGSVTQLFGGEAVYRITPTTEEIARAWNENPPSPIRPWNLRELAPALAEPADDDGPPDHGWDRNDPAYHYGDENDIPY